MEDKKEVRPTAEDVLIAYLLKELQETNKELKELKEKQTSKYESDETGSLYEALAKAQLEMEVAKMDSSNPFFKSKYADLSSIMKASRPYLAKNGLSIIQRILPSHNGTTHLYTRIGHASGQWMESRIPIDPVKKDVQSLGSYITYLRRYSYGALVGVVSSEEDDDGETEMQVHRNSESVKLKNISKAQLQILSEELNGQENLLEYVLKTAKISKLSDLPESRYNNVIAWIRENKNSPEPV